MALPNCGGFDLVQRFLIIAKDLGYPKQRSWQWLTIALSGAANFNPMTDLR
ncbi:hypothetical protein [Chamaesiphon sp. OTE_8_metabat_110]|uniref:hypothetical protein n=1 Tax=Chamaesiphon sp. OTE_8_metabat_110 TaxID=2964696 RepID=UPI00286D2CD3|nr:hypothetical protein [Chamaesiphon sp. OTE_8_metabat_110]